MSKSSSLLLIPLLSCFVAPACAFDPDAADMGLEPESPADTEPPAGEPDVAPQCDLFAGLEVLIPDDLTRAGSTEGATSDHEASCQRDDMHHPDQVWLLRVALPASVRIDLITDDWSGTVEVVQGDCLAGTVLACDAGKDNISVDVADLLPGVDYFVWVDGDDGGRRGRSGEGGDDGDRDEPEIQQGTYDLQFTVTPLGL